MLADAASSIRYANEAALRRRNALLSRHHPVRLVDDWLSDLGTLMEKDSDPVVPEPLIAEIASFLDRLDARLYRSLRRKGGPETSMVLDVLSEAQEQLLLRLALSLDPAVVGVSAP
jgi:hypothetical protein